MIKEHEVAISSNWDDIVEYMRGMGIPDVVRKNRREIVSHGVLLVVDGYGLFLQDRWSYEYMHILHGRYSVSSLYRCLSVMSDEEKDIIRSKNPHELWDAVLPHRRMPSRAYRRMITLKNHLDDLLAMIPSQHENVALNVPKGRLSRGETSMQAAVRELQEETGIVIEVDQLEDVMVDKRLGTDGNIYVTYIYTVSLDHRPNVTLSPEFADYKWMRI